MRKLIQVRGANASGKSTAVRDFIQAGDFKVNTINIFGDEYPYTYDGKVIVGGRYDKGECGGIDACIRKSEVLNEYIVKLLKTLSPEAFIFDAVMYGSTFSYGYRLSNVCKALGYEYIGLTFSPPFETILEWVFKRNGGKEIDIKRLQSKYIASIRSYDRLKAAGVDVRMVDTSAIPKEQTYKLIEAILEEK